MDPHIKAHFNREFGTAPCAIFTSITTYLRILNQVMVLYYWRWHVSSVRACGLSVGSLPAPHALGSIFSDRALDSILLTVGP